MRRDLHRRFLVVEQDSVDLGRDAELRETGARLLREVVRHLEVDVIRRRVVRPRPTLIDDRRQFLGDVEREAVVPAVIEPGLQLLAGVVIKNIDIQLSLLCETGKRPCS